MKPFLRLSGVFIAVSIAMILVVVSVQAGSVLLWPTTGMPIGVAPNGQLNARTVSDGDNGAIIAWQDFRSGVDSDIYAQRVSSSGQVRWAANGISVSAAISDPTNLILTGDGLEGAIVVWQDKRNSNDYNIFAQRVLSNGLTLWNTNGITVCSAPDKQDVPQIASDDQGGAIIVWEDYRSGIQWDVYAQRIAPNGDALWANNGITVGLVNSQLAQPLPIIVRDGDSGAFVAWMIGPSPYSNIAVQHVLSDGTKLWASTGITLTGTGTAVYPQLAPDGNGGLIVVWQSSAGVYVQHVQATGAILWNAGGIKLMSGGLNPSLVSDNAQGAFVAWQAYPNGFAVGSDIFAQHVLSDGTQLWNGEGITVTAAPGHQQIPRVVSDGYDGAIIVWQDTPTNGSLPDHSIWAQRVNSGGIPQWVTNGFTVITGTNSQLSDITSDQLHGAIVAWTDQRNDVGDVYAQRVTDFSATAWIYLPLLRK